MKRGNHSKSRASKGLVLILALVLVFGVAVGGTIAWLTDKTAEIKNTFTTSDVAITLTETTGTSYQMIPGFTITKDPVVAVGDESEACWLFIKVEKSENFDTFMEYEMADGWKALGDAYPGVFYQDGTADTGMVCAKESYPVIKDNTITVRNTITKDQMTNATEPTFTVTAYACQYYSSNGVAMSVADAWTAVPKS